MSSNSVNRSVNIFIQTGDAEKAFDRLTAKEKALKDALAQATDPTQIKNLQAEIDKLQEPISRASKKLSGELSPSLRDIGGTVAKLSAEIKNLSKEDPSYAQKLLQLKTATLEYNKQRAAVNGLAAEHESLSTSLGHLFKHIAEATALYDISELAIEKSIEFAKEIINEVLEAEQANTKLKNILDNIGRADLFESFKGQAEKLHETFKAFKPEDFTNVFTQLSTYGKLSENQIKQLLPVIVDFSRKSGVSLQEATSIIEKALEGNGKSLKEYGINIKDGKDLTERFGIVMTDLKIRVDGAEEAFENTSAGGIAKFKVAIAEIQKNIGQFIENLFAGEKSAETLFQEAKQKTEEYNKTLPPLLKSYDELKSKTNLNKTEQGELQAIIQKIISIVPDAATEFDKYGAALDINKDKVTSFLKENDKFVKIREKSAIDPLIEQAQKSADVIKLLSNNRNRIVSEFNKDFPNGGLTEQGKSLNDLLGGISENIAKEQDKIIATAEKLKSTYRTDLPAAIQVFVDKAKEIKFGSSEDGNDPLIKTKKTVVDTTLTIELLRKKIQDLDAAFEKLGVTDTKAIKANQEAREKLQNQLDALDGKKKDPKKGPDNQFAEDLLKLQQQADKVAELNKTEFQKKLIEAQKQFEAFEALIGQQFQKGQLSRAQRNELDKEAQENFNEETHQLRLGEIKRVFDEQTKADKKMNDERMKIALEGFKNTATALAKLADSQLADKRAEKELAVLEATGKKKLAAEIDQLNQEEIIALNADGVTAEKRLLIEKQFQDKRDKLSKDAALKSAQDYIDAVNNIASQLQSVFSIQNKQAQDEIDRDKSVNDAKKNQYQSQLNSKLITQKEYQRKVDALDKQIADKQNAQKVKQFNQDKILSIARATANVAEAITKAIAAGPGIGQVIAILDAAIGAYEIGVIAQQKPPAYAKGGFIPEGPSHANRGIKLMDGRTGQVRGEIEGGEPILSRATYRNNRALVDSLLDASMNRGGTSLQPGWKNTPVNYMNFSGVQESLSNYRVYAGGGIAPGPATGIEPTDQGMQLQLGLLDAINTLNGHLADGIRASVSLYDLQKQQDRKQKIVNDATGR